jgi:hypothetical protein
MWTGISRPLFEIIVPAPSNTSFQRTGAVENCLSILGAKTILKIESAVERSNCGILGLLG